MARTKKKAQEESISLRGFARVHIIDRKTGKIKADSGWKGNSIQQRGFDQMIVDSINSSGSNPDYLQLGSLTQTPASNNINQMGTFAGDSTREGFAVPTKSLVQTSSGAYLRLTATWTGSDYITGAVDASINAIGMFYHSSGVYDSSCLAGLTYASSSWSSDQDVKATYELRFTQT